MQTIIPAVSKEVLRSELNEQHFVRPANFGNRSIYITDARRSPNVLREIGRLREISFRQSGGGTGLELDLDEYDEGEHPFQQLVVWCNEEEEIVGGYRFQLGSILALNTDGSYNSPTAHLFEYNAPFVEKYLPYCVELGRSFVVPTKQSGMGARGSVYTLDNLWDGLGAVTQLYPDLRYFFGKITMYPSFQPQARDLILYFLSLHCPDTEGLMQPHEPIVLTTPIEELRAAFTGSDFKSDYQTLSRRVRELGEHVPPLFSAYMKLSPTMKSFGTAINHPFGKVEETGILVTIDDIYPDQRQRHLTIRNGK